MKDLREKLEQLGGYDQCTNDNGNIGFYWHFESLDAILALFAKQKEELISELEEAKDIWV